MEPRLAIDCILLAAGASRRFGATDKLLHPVPRLASSAHDSEQARAEVDGDVEPLVTRMARALAEASELQGRRIAVIRAAEKAKLSHSATKIADAVAPFVTHLVVNPAADAGLASSVQAGLTALSPHAAGVLIAQGDMPNMTSDALNELARAFCISNGTTIIVPCAKDGRFRSPIVWPVDLVDALKRVTGDTGGRQLLNEFSDRVQRISLGDDRLFLDIDTQADAAAWSNG